MIATLVSLTVAAGHIWIAPIPALLAWGDVQVLLFPDSADGTLIALNQVYRGPRPEHLLQFSAFVDPDSASRWIPAARLFLVRELPATDTNRVAVSPPLVSPEGETVFFARRRGDSGWTADRYIGVRKRPERRVQYINISPRSAEDFLDSLAAVVLRTPVFDDPPRHWRNAVSEPGDSTDCIMPLPDSPVPRYPVDERNRNMEGTAWASFTITERGTVQTNTVHVLFATRESFARAVRDAAPRFRFEPARRNGVAVSKRVIVPFVFQLTQSGEDWSGSSRNRPNDRCS